MRAEIYDEISELTEEEQKAITDHDDVNFIAIYRNTNHTNYGTALYLFEYPSCHRTYTEYICGPDIIVVAYH